MSTKVYGCSDDLIEFDGDVHGEVGFYEGADEDEDPKGVLLIFSDGTLLRAYYSKPERAIWGIEEIHRGTLLERIDICTDEDADPYSDIAHFKDGLKWAYASTTWQRVR